VCARPQKGTIYLRGGRCIRQGKNRCNLMAAENRKEFLILYALNDKHSDWPAVGNQFQPELFAQLT
jgi:hypothetical protein